MHEANRSSSASFSPPIAGPEGSVKRRGLPPSPQHSYIYKTLFLHSTFELYSPSTHRTIGFESFGTHGILVRFILNVMIFALGTLDRDDVSLTISRATAGSAGAGLAPSFDFSQFEKVPERIIITVFHNLDTFPQEAVAANRLEELCDLVIVLKKDCRPQIIECLLMYFLLPSSHAIFHFIIRAATTPRRHSSHTSL
jgi:hypothetical protein